MIAIGQRLWTTICVSAVEIGVVLGALSSHWAFDKYFGTHIVDLALPIAIPFAAVYAGAFAWILSKRIKP